MRAGRLVLLGVSGLLALLVACVWVLPGMLDWNRYRESIAGLVAAGIGRPVTIQGDINLHLLPQPILTASGLRVDDSGDGVAMAVHELRLRVALGPLLAGRVDARELVLGGADLRLPWPLPPGALSRRPPAWLTGLLARVEASRLLVGNVVLSDIDASVANDPDTGTLSTAGTAKMFARAWRFTARLARPGGDGSAGLDVSLDGQDRLRDTGGTFSGVLAADGALSGRVAGRGPDLSLLIPAPPVGWRGDGRLSAAAGLAVADELAVEIGGSPARGAVALRVQPEARLDVALAAGRLELDEWLPVLLRAAQPGSQPGIPTGIDLSAEAATFAGGTLRQLRGAFDLDSTGVTVRDAGALLPGDAAMTLSGRLPGKNRGTVFEGAAKVRAADLRSTLRWLQPFAPAILSVVPPGTMRAADLSAKFAIDAAQLSLSDLQGTLDGAALQGGLSLRMLPRLGVSAGITLDRLKLDQWLPDPSRFADPAAAFGSLQNDLQHAGFDADVKLQLRTADWRGLEVGPLSIDGQSEAGRLTLRRLEATSLGVRLTASGTIGDNGRVSEARLDASTQDVSALRPWAPPLLAGSPGLLRGPATLLVTMAGPTDALTGRGTLELGDLRVEAQPTIDLGASRVTGALTVQHPGAPRLLELLGMPGTAAWLGDGSLSLISQISVAPERVELNDVQLVAGAARATGQLTLAGREANGRIVAEALPLPTVYARSPAPLPIDGTLPYRGSLHVEAGEVMLGLTPVLQRFAGDITWAEDAFSLDHATAKLSGGDVSATARLEFHQLPRLAVQADAKDIVVSGPLWGSTVDVTAGHLDAQIDASAEGHSPAALLATLSGHAALQVQDGTATGFDLAGAANALSKQQSRVDVTEAVRAALSGGVTRFTRLDVPMTATRGVLAIGAKAVTASGTAGLSGTLDLLGDALDARLALRPSEELPELLVRLTGPAAQPVRTPELAGLARWLAERS